MPVIARVLLCFALVLPVGAQALAPPCNSGRVFEDRDGDGRWSLDERPLPGVLVSDGLRLVRTDARARIALSLDRETEAKVLAAAHLAGVKVAEPIATAARATSTAR